jgi:hypothetical protein
MASDAKINQATKDVIDEPIPSIRIFSYPKVIFIWPTMVCSYICGIGMLLVGDLVTVRDYQNELRRQPADAVATVDPSKGTTPAAEIQLAEGAVVETPEDVAYYFTSWQNMLGLLFLFIFAANLLVMALDFPRFTIVAVFLLATTITFLMLYLANQGVPVLRPLIYLSRHIYAVANAGFYFTIGTLILLMLMVIAGTRYLDYWEVSPNEIMHHHGPLSDLERFPTINLKFSKEIPDILEYLLGLGSGKLSMSFGLDNRSVVLEHVLFISKKEVALKKMMGQLNVRLDER